MKALGTGHTAGVLWHDVEVVRDDGSRSWCSTGAPPSMPAASWLDDRPDDHAR